MIRPTRTAAVLFSCSIPLAVLIVLLRQELWYTAFYLPCAILACMLAETVALARPGSLAVQVRVPGRVFLGQPVALHAFITTTARHMPRPLLGLLECEGHLDPPTPVLATAAAAQKMHADERSYEVHGDVPNNAPQPHAPEQGEAPDQATLVLPLHPQRRGVIAITALWLRWRGRFGLVERTMRHPLQEQVHVLPDIKGVQEAALHFFAHDAIFGEKQQTAKGEGTEFDSLREYTLGMDSRHIDWKRSAKHRKMLVKEFQQERNHHILLAFDTGHLMLEPVDGIPKLDHAIKAGLLLGWVALRSGDFAGGCGFDSTFRSFLEPGRGMPHFTRLQHFTAGLAYRQEEANFTLALTSLNARLKKRTLIVLFTEFTDYIAAELLVETLALLVKKHVVIFVGMQDTLLQTLQNTPPETFENVAQAVVATDFLQERAIVLERIRRLGVHCLQVPATDISPALLNRYLHIKARGIL